VKKLTFILVLIIFLSRLTASAPAKETRRVLVFYEAGFSFPDIAIVDQEIRKSLDESPYQVELYTENMDEIFFAGESSQQEFRQWYIHKYRDRKPDLIIAEGPPSIKFMVEAHERYFPGTPIIFCCSPQGKVNNLHLDSSFTGAWMEIDPAETLDAALRLQPRTRHVVVVGGVSSVDRNVEEITKGALRKYEGRLEFTYLTDLAMPAQLQRLRDLPDSTIVFYTSLSQDAAGTSFIDTKESIPMIVSAANAPVFVLSETFLGQGAVGGAVTSFRAQGKVVGEDALRILRGEKPQNIAIVRNTNIYEFDWEALKRWRLNIDNLPSGSVVLYREPTLWERGRKYFLAGLAVIFLQALLILGLFWQRARRRGAEAELRRSEEKFSKSFKQSPLAITIVSTNDGRYIEVNETFEHETGWRRDEVIDRDPLEIDLWVDPNQKSVFMKQLLAKGNVRDFEVGFRRKDAQIRTVLSSAELIEVNGEPCALSVIADITERKQAQEALASLSGQLINAQEQERSRLARELHDDFNQRLAILAIDLERTVEMIQTSPSEASKRMLELWNRASEIGADLHSLSHRLHSSTLESLGLVLGVSSFCAEFAEQQGIQVDFAHEDIPRSIPPDVALCLFRVVQEGLRNVKKHSGASRAQVRLAGDAEAIHLSLTDNGSGFNFQRTSANVGLGIRSLQERLRMVGGAFEVRSQPTQGTQIAASVPLKPSVATNSNQPASLPVEVHSQHPVQVTPLGKGGGL
jgi:PAS domain S-box-containing protein